MITWENVKTNRIQNGRWKEFNKHAVLIAEGYYVDGKKHGTWREFYDETGNIMIEENYVHGVQHGPYTSFHPNGKVFSSGQFVKGSREGFFTVYDEQGNYTRHLFFVNNVQIQDSELVPAEERTESGRAAN